VAALGDALASFGLLLKNQINKKIKFKFKI